jgi:very-short-patch-repair endonuclease
MRHDRELIYHAQELRRNMTDCERKLWRRLKHRELGFKFRRQMPIGNYIADFACPAARIVIELDGGQHGSDEAEALDRIRTAAIERSGFRVIRFWNHEVIEQLDDVVEKIWNELYTPTLALPLEGEGSCQEPEPVGAHDPFDLRRAEVPQQLA